MKIVARDLREEALHEQLKEVFGESNIIIEQLEKRRI